MLYGGNGGVCAAWRCNHLDPLAGKETPFEKENSRAVRGIGLLVVVYSLIHTLVLPLLCLALGLGRAQVSLVDGKMVLVGCLIISLSYIFEYGSARGERYVHYTSA